MRHIGTRQVREETADILGGAEAFGNSMAKQIAAMMYRDMANNSQKKERAHSGTICKTAE